MRSYGFVEIGVEFLHFKSLTFFTSKGATAHVPHFGAKTPSTLYINSAHLHQQPSDGCESRAPRSNLPLIINLIQDMQMSLCFHLTHLTIFHGSSTAQMHGTVWLSCAALDSDALKQVVIWNLFRTIAENYGCHRLWVGSWWFWVSAVNKLRFTASVPEKGDTRKPKSSKCCHDMSWKFKLLLKLTGGKEMHEIQNFP